MRALAARPRQIATIWRCATGSVPDAGVERQVGVEPGERRLRSRRASPPRRRPQRRRRARGRWRCSPRTVRFGKSERSWKMTWMPSDRAWCGRQAGVGDAVDRRSPRRDRAHARRSRILISVDLPEPFSPTRQCTSPALDRPVDPVERHRPAEPLAHARRAGGTAWRLGVAGDDSRARSRPPGPGEPAPTGAGAAELISLGADQISSPLVDRLGLRSISLLARITRSRRRPGPAPCREGPCRR